jgi:hypothetical protein
MTLIVEIEDKKVQKAEAIAQQQGKSLSFLIENYFDSLVEEDFSVVKKLKKMTASLHQSPDFDHRSDYNSYLNKKHE